MNIFNFIGQKEWVHLAPVPDSYRGKYRSTDYNEEQLGELYANEVVKLVENAEKKGRRIALFLAESLQSCGGQITCNFTINVFTVRNRT